MIQTLLGPIVDLVGGHLQRKAEEKKAVHERKMVAIEQDANWENIHANNSANSWKDEWFTILFSVPCVLAFFPSMVPVVMNGFAALALTLVLAVADVVKTSVILILVLALDYKAH